MPAVFSIIGLVLNVSGVLVLFYYGMPYRVRRGGDPAAERFSIWSSITLVCLASEPS